MTVSVAFNGTVIDTADTTTGWSLVKITSGGGTPSIALADAAYEGNNNLTTRSDNKKIYVYYDIGSGNELDFTGGGNADGDMFYIWVNFLPSPLLALRSVGGLGVFMESRTPTSSVYSLWYFHGRDTYTGGWIRLAIDPTKTPSETAGAGAFDPTAVRYFGAFAYNNQATAKYDNFVWDQCAYGKGLIVTGSSTLGLAKELITDEETNRHGIVTPLNSSGTAAEVLGTIILGDDVGTAATTITDEDSKFFAAEPLFYETTLKPSLPLGGIGLSVVGNATGDTSVIMGQAVGTTSGRNGISIVGNSTYDLNFDRDDGAVETADFYGCSLENFTGTISLDGIHDFNGDTISGSSGMTIAAGAEVKNLTQVLSGLITLTTTAKLTDSIIINNTATSAVTTSDLSNITGTSFTSDGTGHAVTITATGTYDWDANQDSGYGATGTTNATVYNNSGGLVTINVQNGGSTPTYYNGAGASTSVVAGAITIQVKAALKDGTPVESARVYLRASDGTGPFPFEDTVTITRSSTTATVAHTAHGMASGDKVAILGIANKTEDRGIHTITVTGVDAYTFVTTDSGATSYTGTIKSTFVALSGLTNASGILSTSRVYPSTQPVTGWTRKSSTNPYLQEGVLVGSISSTTGFDGTAVMLADG